MQTFAALEVIVHLKTYLLRCKLRIQLPKNLKPRSLDLKIQNRLIKRLLFLPTLINQGKPFVKIRKKSILRKNGIKKTLLKPQKIMLLRVKKSEIIEATKSAIIVKKGLFCWKL